jgi:NADH:ubiquinone oxidoreductase subunit B-like Fe-S oxidoreductase
MMLTGVPCFRNGAIIKAMPRQTDIRVVLGSMYNQLLVHEQH